jgi:hypothetical protein
MVGRLILALLFFGGTTLLAMPVVGYEDTVVGAVVVVAESRANEQYTDPSSRDGIQ